MGRTEGGSREGLELRLDDVSFTYPDSSAGVSHVSLRAEPGAIYGLLGQNGAGKTTLMRLMLGLLEPASGRILVGDRGLGADRRRLLSSIGSLIELPSLYLHLRGREHLRVFAAYYGVPDESADAALDLVGLGGAAETLVRQYSLGMKQRLGLATALLHEPEVLVLDEPMNGLDPGGIAELRTLLGRLAVDGKAVIVSSHLLAEVEKTASRIGIIHEGRLRFEGSPADLAARTRSRGGLILRVSNPAAAANLLAASGRRCRPESEGLFVEDVDEAEVPEIVRRLVGGGHDVWEVRPRVASLEEDLLNFVREPSDAS